MIPGLPDPAEATSREEHKGLCLTPKVMVPMAILLWAWVGIPSPCCSSSVVLLDFPQWQEKQETRVGEAGGVVVVDSQAFPVGTFSFAMNLLDS